MKGFMHVVEILLVIVLVFFVFMQFASIPSISGDWTKTKLSLMGSDVLRTFEKKGVDWFNETSLRKEFNQTLPENLIYAVTLENVIKPKIKIGCLCNGSELSAANAMLSPGWFMINGVNTTFDIVKVNNLNESFSLDFDVALIYGYRNLTQSIAPMRNFLGYDKGVVEITDIPRIDDAQKSIFGLNSTSQRSGGMGIVFSAASRENGKEINKIYDYFEHIPLFYDSFERLDQWAGDANLSSAGNPTPSVKLSGNDCFSDAKFIFTRFYDSFKAGEIDFDAYLPQGSSLFIGFVKSGGYEYLASLSTNASNGYDSFYIRSPLQSTGSNMSHLTQPLRWNRIKIIADGASLSLYNNGEKVASAMSAGVSPSNISLSARCGDAYVDNIRVTEGENKDMDNFLQNENITQISNNANKVLLVQKGTNLPASIINYNVEGIGRGRTAWISGNANYASEDYRTLVRSLVTWASGSEHKIIKADIKNGVSSYIYRPMSRDMFENAKIVLELGYLY
jgi:hypothetical protein